jgi:RNase P subunit RPR2
MSIAMTKLQGNYLKLRHDLAAAGYQLAIPVTADDQAQALQIQRTICQECNNLLAYQVWVNRDSSRRLVVCLECYTATER